MTPSLRDSTVVVIGGSSGIGLETARQARAQGADVVLAGRNPDRLRAAAAEVDALDTAAFDAIDADALRRFVHDLPSPVDHIMVSAGRQYYAPLPELDIAEARQALDEHVWLPLQVGQLAPGAVRPGGSLLFVTGTGTVARRPAVGLTMAAIAAAAVPRLTANLALELAPIRVNVIAAGFVDTPLSVSLLGAELDTRRDPLRATLSIGRVVTAADVAAVAVHLMANTALTGATYDIDGGGQVVGY
jgi:NAD(P)-dependent dehydrogenase (short-subunit alcohol dehydrogenase family)